MSQPSAKAVELIDALVKYERQYGHAVAKNIAIVGFDPRAALDAFIADLERRVGEAHCSMHDGTAICRGCSVEEANNARIETSKCLASISAERDALAARVTEMANALHVLGRHHNMNGATSDYGDMVRKTARAALTPRTDGGGAKEAK